MENEHLIALQNICTNYNIEVSFIRSLSDFGLVEIITVDETPYVDSERLGDIEKMMRLHYDLDINLAGIDAISNLLQRMHDLQKEITLLRNQLSNHQ